MTVDRRVSVVAPAVTSVPIPATVAFSAAVKPRVAVPICTLAGTGGSGYLQYVVAPVIWNTVVCNIGGIFTADLAAGTIRTAKTGIYFVQATNMSAAWWPPPAPAELPPFVTISPNVPHGETMPSQVGLTPSQIYSTPQLTMKAHVGAVIGLRAGESVGMKLSSYGAMYCQGSFTVYWVANGTPRH